jgi:sec-independent protein translocase protein TatC
MNDAAVPASSDEGRMTFMEHLIELRSRVIKSLIAVGIGAVAGWFLYPYVIDLLLGPYREIAERSLTQGQLLATGPAEGFAIRIKLTLYVAIALAMPVLLWQLWQFVSPGLYKHERRYALPFVFSAVVLFLSGATIAYLTLPAALNWLSAIGGTEITQAYTADKYFQLIAYMMLAFGVCFEFPILLLFLQMAGIVKNAQLRQFWRQTVVGITIVVAVATPSNDPISMAALTVPLVVFFFGAIGVGWVLERRKRKAKAKAQTSAEP